MSRLYEAIKEAEMLGFAFLVTSTMVLGVSLIFFIAILFITDKKPMAILRPVKELEIIKQYLIYLKSNVNFYLGSTMNLDEGKSFEGGQRQRDIAMLVLKNYGACSAIDIQITNFENYRVEENFANKYVSLQQGEHTVFLIDIPKELLSPYKISSVKVKFKDQSNSIRSCKFTTIADPTLTFDLTENVLIHTFIQS